MYRMLYIYRHVTRYMSIKSFLTVLVFELNVCIYYIGISTIAISTQFAGGLRTLFFGFLLVY